MDIKIAHARIENKIVNLLEPLATLAWTLGFEYHHGLLEKMWKEILKNHAHDSIGCCCSDKVHREIVARFELAEDMADNLLRFYMRKIADNMPQSDADKLVLFNLMPWPREEVINTTVRLRASQFNLRDDRGQPVPYFIRHAREIDPGLIDRQIVHYGNYDPFMEFDIQINQIVPSMGYRTLYIEANQPGNVIAAKSDAEGILENAFWQIALNEDGSLQLVDKDSGAQETGPKESQAEPVEFPYDVPGTGITVQNISSYSGIYVEDGSDQEISNVSAMQMYNSGSNAVEYVSVSVKCNGEQLEFEASDIPAGASVMVQEKNKKAYQSGTYTECVGTAAKVDGFGMSEDKVQVTPNDDNTFTVTNLTEETIPCVRIFYKLYMEDKGIYVGGITYNVKVTELEAGTSQTVSPSHYAQGYSRLMMVRTYDTTE